MREILFVYVFAFYEISTLKYIVNIASEKKVAYLSCCILFEMNSCEFARTTIRDEHSTTILFVRSEEQEQEMLSTSFNVTVVKDTTSRKKRMMVINNRNSINKRKSTQEE